jgi:hypothetical protein
MPQYPVGPQTKSKPRAGQPGAIRFVQPKGAIHCRATLQRRYAQSVALPQEYEELLVYSTYSEKDLVPSQGRKVLDLSRTPSALLKPVATPLAATLLMIAV